jgi:biotin synthase-related radical SAM superfamily protein
MKRACAVCGRKRDESTMKVFATSTLERATLRKLGESTPEDSYAFCRSCVGILSNPATAIPLMKGIIQFQARAAGVTPHNAERIAERFGKRVMDITPSKPRS